MYRDPQSTRMNTALDGFTAVGTDTPELQKPCPVCGNQDFEWGRIYGQAYYVPGMEGLYSLRRRPYQVIKMRRCLRCSNLLAFTDPELTRRQRGTTTVIAILAIAFALLVGLGSILAAFSASRP